MEEKEDVRTGLAGLIAIPVYIFVMMMIIRGLMALFS